MISPSASELSHVVNREARLQYPQVAELLGASSLLTTVAPRLALRMETPYPYSFMEDDTMLPSGGEAFGRVIGRNRQSGLEEIHASLSHQDREHKWLYLPHATLWVDTTIEAGEASVDSDQYAYIFLSHIFPTVEAVHTHPDNTVKDLVEDFPWGYSENYLLEAAQPSTSDLNWHYLMTRRTSPGSHLTSSIVSHYGVTSFSLNDAGASSKSFGTEQYNRLISDSSDPINAIRTVLGEMSTHVVTHGGEPALDVMFEPIY